MVNALNQQIELHRSELQEKQAHGGKSKNDLDSGRKSSSQKTQKSDPTSGANNSEQTAIDEEKRQAIISRLADLRSDIKKISEGNIKAMNEEGKQTLSIQALITSKTAQLQEKIDDYENQIQNLKRELKVQKGLVQQHTNEAADARERLGIYSTFFRNCIY